MDIESQEQTKLSYQGSRMPWWVSLIWISSFGWAVSYLVIHFMP
jgi:hypothetical protein